VRRSLRAGAAHEQDADDAAVRGVERRRHPAHGTELRQGLAVEHLGGRGRVAGRVTGEPDGGTARDQIAARVDDPALALVPVDLPQHEIASRGDAFEQVEDRRRGIGKAAETPRGEAGQGVEDLRAHGGSLS
jgi:hypothetical protein